MNTRIVERFEGYKVIFDCYIRDNTFYTNEIKILKNNKALWGDEFKQAENLYPEKVKKFFNLNGVKLDGSKWNEACNTSYNIKRYLSFLCEGHTQKRELENLNKTFEEYKKVYIKAVERNNFGGAGLLPKQVTDVKNRLKNKTLDFYRKLEHYSGKDLLNGLFDFKKDDWYLLQKVIIKLERLDEFPKLGSLCNKYANFKRKFESGHYIESIDELERSTNIHIDDLKSIIILDNESLENSLKEIYSKIAEKRKIELDKLITEYKINTVK